jgi:phospholipid/cholesterol/gamma-HCH transport system substrate-binding protein
MRATGIKLTAFTILTVLATYWLGAVIGNFSPLRDSYNVHAMFTDASGVLKGDLVKIAGVDVGKVADFEVSGGTAVVTLEIDSDIELPENVIADIKFRNLLGQRLINLIPPDDPRGTLEDGSAIPVTQTRPALDLSVVFNNLRPLIQTASPEDINTVARAIVEVFEGREGDLAAVFGNLGEITEVLAGRGQRLGRMVESLDDLTGFLNEQSGDIEAGLQEFTRFMEGIAELTPQVERTVDLLENATRRTGRLVADNRTNLNRALSDLALVLEIVDEHLGPLDRITRNLKEVLLGTARSQSYGKWWNLYIVNLCLETEPAMGIPQSALPPPLECEV